MHLHFPATCYVTATIVVLGWTAIFTWFSSMAEPEEFSLLVPVFGIIAGVIGQSGLLLAPWSLRRGIAVKLLVLAALLPPLFLLGHTLFEYIDFDGFVPQSKVQLPLALGAFMVHIWAFVRVARALSSASSHAA